MANVDGCIPCRRTWLPFSDRILYDRDLGFKNGKTGERSFLASVEEYPRVMVSGIPNRSGTWADLHRL